MISEKIKCYFEDMISTPFGKDIKTLFEGVELIKSSDFEYVEKYKCKLLVIHLSINVFGQLKHIDSIVVDSDYIKIKEESVQEATNFILNIIPKIHQQILEIVNQINNN